MHIFETKKKLEVNETTKKREKERKCLITKRLSAIFSSSFRTISNFN